MIQASTEQAIINGAMRKYDEVNIISDLEAKVIASSYHDGQNSAFYKLASTGTIDNTDGQLGGELERAENIAHQLPITDERKAIWSLKAYIAFHGTRGPQEHWKDITW
jgi:hypothetical protein